MNKIVLYFSNLSDSQKCFLTINLFNPPFLQGAVSSFQWDIVFRDHNIGVYFLKRCFRLFDSS